MLFDFRCKSCNKVEEHWVSSDIHTVECQCGEVATRCVGGTVILDPISGDFPGATMKWARHHEKAAKQPVE